MFCASIPKDKATGHGAFLSTRRVLRKARSSHLGGYAEYIRITYPSKNHRITESFFRSRLTQIDHCELSFRMNWDDLALTREKEHGRNLQKSIQTLPVSMHQSYPLLPLGDKKHTGALHVIKDLSSDAPPILAERFYQNLFNNVQHLCLLQETGQTFASPRRCT